MKALGKNLVVQPNKQETKTSAGLYLSSSDNTNIVVCKVLSVGDLVESKVKKDDNVCVIKGTVNEVIFNEQTYYILHEDGAVAIYDNN